MVVNSSLVSFNSGYIQWKALSMLNRASYETMMRNHFEIEPDT